MKKLLVLALCLIMCAAPLAACSGGDGTTAPETDPETTTYDYTKIPDVIEPHEESLISADELGFEPILVKTDKYWVADGVITEDGDLSVTSYNPGVAVVTVTNCYSETVDVSVTVALDYSIESIEFDRFERAENSVVATDYGVNTSNADNASYFQAAIDAVADMGGGTVYIPKGIYKSKIIELKENVTLRLEGLLSEYNTEYTQELDHAIANGEFAVMQANGSDMFVNHKPNGWGREGADNFAIYGGVFDMMGGSRCFIWCCADGVTLENVIMKDCPSNHAIQITGTRNVTIRNVMFAGYKTSSGSSETVQIETSHPGAINSSSEIKQSYFNYYECYTCANVTFENVYFGKSLKYDSHNIPIGHHGHQTDDVLKGLRIINCTFDNPRHVALRAYAYSDVEIRGCSFISDRANQASSNRRMIELTLNTGNVSYKGGYLTIEADRGGCRNWVIRDNTFTIGAESTISGIIEVLEYGNTSVDAIAYSNVNLFDDYKSNPRVFVGYKMMTNRMENIAIYNNVFNIDSKYVNALFDLRYVKGVDIRDNEINASVKLYVGNFEGEEIVGGDLLNSISSEAFSKRFDVSCISGNDLRPIVLLGTEAETEVFCNASNKKTAVMLSFTAGEGGRIDRRADDDGTLYVEPVADEGYVFDGYYVGGERLDGDRFEFDATVDVEVRFVSAE